MNLKLRPVSLDECELLFRWVNDPEVRKNSFDSSHIAWKSHEEWFLKKVNNENTVILILELDKIPIGQIRFDKKEKDDIYFIDFSIDSAYRGSGFGGKIIKLGCQFFQTHLNHKKLYFIGEVKFENIASQKSFLSNGFLVKSKDFNKIIFEKIVSS